MPILRSSDAGRQDDLRCSLLLYYDEADMLSKSEQPCVPQGFAAAVTLPATLGPAEVTCNIVR